MAQAKPRGLLALGIPLTSPYALKKKYLEKNEVYLTFDPDMIEAFGNFIQAGNSGCGNRGPVPAFSTKNLDKWCSLAEGNYKESIFFKRIVQLLFYMQKLKTEGGQKFKTILKEEYGWNEYNLKGVGNNYRWLEYFQWPLELLFSNQLTARTSKNSPKNYYLTTEPFPSKCLNVLEMVSKLDLFPKK